MLSLHGFNASLLAVKLLASRVSVAVSWGVSMVLVAVSWGVLSLHGFDASAVKLFVSRVLVAVSWGVTCCTSHRSIAMPQIFLLSDFFAFIFSEILEGGFFGDDHGRIGSRHLFLKFDLLSNISLISFLEDSHVVFVQDHMNE